MRTDPLPASIPFDVYPAIDLRRGQVVRLAQGDPDKQTLYSREPGEVARRWITAGAAWLHVVNLDGAFGGADQANLKALERILDAVRDLSPGARVQFGGGLRDLEAIHWALALGVNRVILGTAVVESPGLVQRALTRFGSEAIVAGIDAREGRVRVRGWSEDSGLDPIALGGKLAEWGVRTAIFTDITRDGMGAGVDLDTPREIAARTGLAVIASGGVASLEDIRAVRAARLRGVIIGQALYQGSIRLEEALRC